MKSVLSPPPVRDLTRGKVQTSHKRHNGPRIILVLKGGMGNQLFSYAAARRLALVNGAELIINHIAGFKGDYYRRYYCLHHFNIPQNLISPRSPAARLGRHTRYGLGKLSQLLPLEKRRYILEEKEGFDRRIYDLKVRGNIHLEGYWQSEKYFADIEQTIREEFRIVTPHAPENVELASKIKQTQSVCLHTRLMHGSAGKDAKPIDRFKILDAAYFLQAARIIAARVKDPHFFVFSDYPPWVKDNVKLDFPMTFVTNNKGDSKNYEDLWLMSLCRHFIIANSTFSWWGAWLSSNKDKIIIAPNPKSWGVAHFSEHLVCSNWLMI